MHSSVDQKQFRNEQIQEIIDYSKESIWKLNVSCDTGTKETKFKRKSTNLQNSKYFNTIQFN